MQRKEPIVSFEDQAPKKETKLNLDEFPLKSIKTIDDFKREIQGTSLLRAAQEQQNQRYLNFFYNIR